MVGADGENGYLVSAAQFRNIFHFAIEYDPRNPRGCRRSCDLWHRRSTYRLKNNAVGMRFGVGLNDFQKLLTLQDGIILGIEDLQVAAEALRSFFSSRRLLHLVVIVASGQRDDKFQLLHRGPLITNVRTTCALRSAEMILT